MTSTAPTGAAAGRPERGLGPVARLGRGTLGLGREIVALAVLARDTAASAGRMERALAVRQLYELGNRSALFVVIVLGFTGAILVIQASLQAQRIIGDLGLIGPTFLQLLVREFGASITGLMVAARYGAGIAAEIGAMVVTEQVDALRMAGEEPPAYLVAPRVVAGIVGTLALAVVGSAAAYLAGGFAGYHGFGISPESYYRLTLVRGVDVVIGVVKALLFGAAVPLVASHEGLAAHGGAAGVGRATTRAVIGGSLAVLVLDLAVGSVAQLFEEP